MNSLSHWYRWRLGLFIAVALIINFPAISGDFIWDDDAYITTNAALLDLQGLRQIWFDPWKVNLVQYYPLTFTTFWIEHKLWGLNPIGYHITNIFLHAINAFLLWKILERLKVPGAWFAALVFLIHPVQVESVAWITERKNVLSGMFYFSACLAYFRFKETNTKSQYFLSYLFFLFALFSKTVTATFSASLLLIFWWKERKIPWMDLIRLIPFFLTGLILGAITMDFENYHITSLATNEWTYTFIERILIVGRVLWFYLAKLLWPHPVTFIYPLWNIDPTEFWQWLFPISFAILFICLWIFRTRIGRAPFVCLAFFVLTILPASGIKSFFPMRFSFVANHFQYLAMIGPVAGIVALAFHFLNHKKTEIKTAIGTAVLLSLAILSWNHSKIYQNLEILWRDTLSKNPTAWIAHNNLGNILLLNNRDSEAEYHFNEGYKINPLAAELPNNLGAIMNRRGLLEEAKTLYEEAVRLLPLSAEYQNNLGALLIEMGKTEEAAPYLLKAMENNPELPDSYANYGNIMLMNENIEEAVKYYKKAIEVDPNFADAYVDLGLVEMKLDRVKEAITQYVKALQLDPNHAMAHNNLANALSHQTQMDLAEHHYKEALRIDPFNTLYRNNYAGFLTGQKRNDEAIEQYNQVIEIDPSNPDAQRNIKKLAFSFGNLPLETEQ